MIQAATVAWVIAAQERFLFVEENIEGVLTLNQPAGHWEPGENLIAAAKRELWEETGLTLAPQGLVGLYHLTLPHKTFWRHVFYARIDSPMATFPQDSDILNCQWLSLAELENRPLRSHLVTDCIADFQSGHHYPLSVLR
ncbi:NUDIX domain-containing protein [Gallaecimonas mangrovi]|uniref:NUDIX domain-containing protein n=1 Tax=Gallaecimonas mangrovi TaxID=2291597 RepID=UPI000E209368|nr:NUDIX domain-containing protein [Gallaecimonas mangrovi]